MIKRHLKQLVILNLVISGHCTIIHIALAMALSYIASNSIFVFTLFTGLYLMSMGLGALLVEKINISSPRFMLLIFLNGLVAILLANPGITGIILLNEYGRVLLRQGHVDLLWIIFPLGMILTSFIGIVSGAELPMFSKLIEKHDSSSAKPIIQILASDYFGASLGIILFTFILNPFVGLIHSIFLTQIVTLACINGIYFTLYKFSDHLRLSFGLILINLYVLIMYLGREDFVRWIDQISAIK